MSSNLRKTAWAAAAVIASVGSISAAFAQPPEFVRAEKQRKAFVRAEASSKAARPAQPATEAQAIDQMQVLPDGIIEIPLPADRMLHMKRTVDARGNAHVGHGDTKGSSHAHLHTTRNGSKPNE